MGLCHLQENALFKIYTQSCIFYGISGRDKAQAPAALVMRYHIMYKFISKWFQKKTFHLLSQTPTGPAWRRRRVGRNPERIT